MSDPRLPSPFPQREVVRLDWKAYFIVFCTTHGEPVEYEGKLLFRDGWGYSKTSYEGPEYPPPLDVKELDALVLRYWNLRLSWLRKLLMKWQHDRDTMQKLQLGRSVPLQQVTTVETDEGKKRGYKPVDMRPFNIRIEWVERDIDECVERLQEIEKHYGEKT